MKGEVVDSLPLAVLFAPDEDLAVIRGRCEDGAVLGVGLTGRVLDLGLCLKALSAMHVPRRHTRLRRHD